jgi:hypothetical protein
MQAARAKLVSNCRQSVLGCSLKQNQQISRAVPDDIFIVASEVGNEAEYILLPFRDFIAEIYRTGS